MEQIHWQENRTFEQRSGVIPTLSILVIAIGLAMDAFEEVYTGKSVPAPHKH